MQATSKRAIEIRSFIWFLLKVFNCGGGGAAALLIKEIIF
jgi:hypothetical protein